MSSTQLASACRQIGRLFGAGTLAGLGEGQLLDRFVARRDDDAFEAIVARHGPMVLAVCRSLLRDPNDVDDAFQATFLVLVKRADSVRHRDLLGPWLHGVARRVAIRARSDAARCGNGVRNRFAANRFLTPFPMTRSRASTNAARSTPRSTACRRRIGRRSCSATSRAGPTRRRCASWGGRWGRCAAGSPGPATCFADAWRGGASG